MPVSEKNDTGHSDPDYAPWWDNIADHREDVN